MEETLERSYLMPAAYLMAWEPTCRRWWKQWTSPRMAGAGLRVYPALSYSTGDMYPSDECRRMRLKKTSMDSNRLDLASSLVAKNSP